MNYWNNLLDLHKINYSTENIGYLNSLKFPGITPNPVYLKRRYQSGGAKFKFNNYEITLVSTEDNNSIIYSLKNSRDCLIISIDKNIIGLAEIFGISADYGCYDDNRNRMKGSDLLNLAIYFIEKKKKFKTKENKIIIVNRIELTDNSHISCNGQKIRLSNLYTLLNGETWYMSRGFTPIGKFNKEALYLFQNMMENKNKINKLTVEKSKVYEFLISIKNKNINKNMIDELITFAKNNGNKPLSYLFKKIKENFNKYCDIMLDLTMKFYGNIGLHSFYNERFALKIN